MKLCVLIPAYNEAGHIGTLVGSIRQRNLDVVVVDDGSGDGTARAAQEAGADVLRHDRNLGKGAALATGFSHCLAHGYDAVMTVDGDGQHHPEDIQQFISRAERDGDIIVGDRLHSPHAMPLVRLLTNRCMSWIISGVAGQRIPDTQCGFRLIKRRVLETIALSTSKYEIESEILIKAARSGFTIVSVPVKSIYRDEKSHINPFVDTIRFIRYLAGEFFSGHRKSPV
jgi:glycosyltransferase involved in cell wall biosynthesis